MKLIESLLRRQIGLDSASVGSSLIERSIRLRMKSLGLTRTEEYRALIERSEDEWNELVESVVVAETWFFRDREPFVTFANLVRTEWLPQNPGKSLRVLSVPCSTGEEPYSLAMALIDVDLPRNRFTIDAVDLSARALERAQRAVYGKNSFRGKTLEFRTRHFSETENGYALRREICDCVQFHRGNLLDEKFFAERAGYDFLFCRNLLIYFDRATQGLALKQIHQLLSPRGVLFVGPAEMPIVVDHGFASANLPMSFACRKVEAQSASSEINNRAASNKLRRGRAAVPGSGVRGERTESKNRTVSPESRVRSQPSEVRLRMPGPGATHLITREQLDELASARALADAGKLEEAAALCESHIQERGPNATAYYLLGLVRDAAGDPTAIDCYRKALYLQPDHYETLLQLALLLEKNGDAIEARSLKRRAQRLQQKPSSRFEPAGDGKLRAESDTEFRKGSEG